MSLWRNGIFLFSPGAFLFIFLAVGITVLCVYFAKPPGNPPGTSIKFYNSGLVGTGSVGDRNTTTATCSAEAGRLSLKCSATPMFITYTTSSIEDFPTTYNFNADTIAVTNAAGNATIASSWNSALSGQELTKTLVAAGVFPGGTTGFYTGNITEGASNCTDWTFGGNSPTVRGRAGLASTIGIPTWYSSTSSQCDVQRPFMCVCVGK